MKIILVTLFSLFSLGAMADFQLRGQYHYASVSPGDLQAIDQALYGSSYPKHSGISGLGVDAMYYFPVINIGGGIRYEAWSNKIAGGIYEQTLTANRTSLVAGYRFFETGLYLGAIATYGLSHDLKMATTNSFELSTGSQQSFSLGVEGGIKFGKLIAGAEVGYLSYMGSDVKNGSASILVSGSKSKIDLSGVYLKALVGIVF